MKSMYRTLTLTHTTSTSADSSAVCRGRVLQKKPRQSGSSKMYARILVSSRTQFNTEHTHSDNSSSSSNGSCSSSSSSSTRSRSSSSSSSSSSGSKSTSSSSSSSSGSKSIIYQTRRKILHRQPSLLHRSSSFLWRFETMRVKQSEASLQPKSAGLAALVTASTINRLGQYASSPGNRAYCYAELAVSSPVHNYSFCPPKERWPRWVLPTNGHLPE